MKRQRIRKLLLIISLLLFPITLYYFSPYVIIQGAMEGIITGSFIVFVVMFLSSIFLGRLFCGYICPAGGLQECLASVNSSTAKQGKRDLIKYFIWVPWILMIVIAFVSKGVIKRIDFLYFTDHGISISKIQNYVIYYVVILLIVIPTVLMGKRSFCHYFCWMAPFMILGSKVGNKLKIPSLKITADSTKCVNCNRCNQICSMGLDVHTMVKSGDMKNSECILCGACIDTCKNKAIKYGNKLK